MLLWGISCLMSLVSEYTIRDCHCVRTREDSIQSDTYSKMGRKILLYAKRKLILTLSTNCDH